MDNRPSTIGANLIALTMFMALRRNYMKGFKRIITSLVFFAMLSSCFLHKRPGHPMRERRNAPVGTINIPDTTTHTPKARTVPDPSPAPIPNPNPNPPSPNPPV